MNAQQLHHQSAPREFLHSVDPEDFAPMHLSGRVMKEDSCWGEYESEYEESFSSHDLTFFNDGACE